MASVAGSAPSVKDCLYVANTASTAGGGMYNSASTTSVSGCEFTGNTAPSVKGGGIFNVQCSPSIMQCVFVGNSSEFGAAVYNSTCPAPVATNCEFLGNTAFGGAGVYNFNNTNISPSSSFSAINCVFVGNVATEGPAIQNVGGYLSGSPIGEVTTILNCSFSSNTGRQGSALYNWAGSSATLTNSILWGDSGAPEINNTTTCTISYSDVAGTSLGGSNISADPLFVRIPNSGPDSTWATADDDYGDLRLESGSPCIDTGSSAAVPGGVTTDIAGKSRFVGSAVDMGAYEHGAPATITGAAGNNSYYAQLSADGSALQVWAGSTPSGSPSASYATSTLESLSFDTSAGGNNSLVVDLSNGMPADLGFIGGTGANNVIVTGLGSSSIINGQPNWFSFGPAAISTSGNVTTTIDGAASGATISPLSCNIAATLAIAAGRQLIFSPTQLNFAGSGKLDLADEELIANATVATVQSNIKSGQLFTSAPNGVLGYRDFGNGQTEVRFTLLGDSDLDQTVNVADLANLAGNFGKTAGAVWLQGDFDYNGIVNVADLADLAGNFGQSLSGSGGGTAAVPAVLPAIKIEVTPLAPLPDISSIAATPFSDLADSLYRQLEAIWATA
jgi:hypothetical protein